MKTYPMTSVFYRKFWMKYIEKSEFIRLLTYFPYDKEEAKTLLQKEYGWRPYPQKHFESIFTRFYEGYWLPERFGYDPRRVEFSSLILFGQMTREGFGIIGVAGSIFVYKGKYKTVLIQYLFPEEKNKIQSLK